ncbi:MAG TPA: MOSC domain-containing protein [Gemmatimonadales bacterium]|nr:MOSC domain-containing protein [Gemmatimonadales bacterium]
MTRPGVVSVNVGLPQRLEWRGELVETAIFKQAVAGPVRVGQLNLEGDRQADPTVHGGADKAVYAYPSEHYPFWQEELGGALPWGALGENLTLAGLVESAVRIGDRLAIGSAEFVVTQPRMPCFKLGLRHRRADLVKRFEQAGRPGFYLAVTREGSLQAGQRVSLTRAPEGALTVLEIARLRTAKQPQRALVQRAAALEGLSTGWREYFHRRLLAESVE